MPVLDRGRLPLNGPAPSSLNTPARANSTLSPASVGVPHLGSDFPLEAVSAITDAGLVPRPMGQRDAMPTLSTSLPFHKSLMVDHFCYEVCGIYIFARSLIPLFIPSPISSSSKPGTLQS